MVGVDWRCPERDMTEIQKAVLKGIQYRDANSEGKFKGLDRGSAGISTEMARDGLEGVGTGYNSNIIHGHRTLKTLHPV